MDEVIKNNKDNIDKIEEAKEEEGSSKKIKTRSGSGYLKQLYSTARSTAGTTHSHFKNLTTFLVNFIPVDKVDASELQVRVHFDDAEIQGLAKSIKEHGVLQPILVVQNGDRYKVIAGERRLRASKLAGLERIPARVITSDDKAVHEIALRENLDRVDLHPLEEGEGYLSLLETQAYTTHEGIAQAFGKPKSRITECIGYTKLPDETKKLLMQRNIKQRSALRKLLATPVEEHVQLITQMDPQQDEEVLGTEAAGLQKNSTKSRTPELKGIKLIKPFEYRCDAKGVQVAGFRWKVGEGKERLQEFKDKVTLLLKELEEEFSI